MLSIVNQCMAILPVARIIPGRDDRGRARAEATTRISCPTQAAICSIVRLFRTVRRPTRGVVEHAWVDLLFIAREMQVREIPQRQVAGDLNGSSPRPRGQVMYQIKAPASSFSRGL